MVRLENPPTRDRSAEIGATQNQPRAQIAAHPEHRVRSTVDIGYTRPADQRARDARVASCVRHVISRDRRCAWHCTIHRLGAISQSHRERAIRRTPVTSSPESTFTTPPERFLSAVRAIRDRRRRRRSAMILACAIGFSAIALPQFLLPSNADAHQAAWFESMLPVDAPLNAARPVDIRAGDRCLPPDSL